MLEFGSAEQFLQFLQNNPKTLDPAHVASIAAGIAARGSIQTRRFGPQPVQVLDANYRESIQSMGMPTRCLALLDLLDEHLSYDPAARVLCLEGLTSFARVIRSLYPNAVCSEYAPSREEQERIAPIPHVDIHDMQFPDDSFDAIICAEVLEHVPFLTKALTECLRVLKPGGQLLATFPFAAGQDDTIVRAVLDDFGNVKHLIEPPEYHGNPIRPGEGALVFQVPGWDILKQCKDRAGFDVAEMLYIIDPDRGIMQSEMDGLFVLRAIA